MVNSNRSKEDEIAIQSLREMINFYDRRYFIVRNYEYVEDPELIIIDSYIALCDERTTRYQKEAAYELLKRLVKKELLDSWLEGTTGVHDRDDYRVRKWKREVLKAGRCEKCGSRKNLEAHHIVHWSVYPKGRVDVKNGMCLCDECHAQVHKGELPYAMMMSRIQKRRGVANG